ncbi:bifunctional proline dehydrogenase/L-glutamate gamma-semialdehyde dehydrogenase PutA [Kordiimonas sp. SCSIO 12610]|uniref:bifunctional proline dehydrogenase/L-glutamate gamma-semialdehyde dehydrogenase PutA n=1 Tax=Kordiimonas sp. SCSIO 12610 TaxID=2829597 RepID=UPI002108A242|nr:bifunctional proline dehydrogenase/L-glutamate gamma-semialdehyde dehydrogenase PutA [Kordiimonas sp. SCSIO 12610]UTW56321.1 bifunctional proline dehydrogenase/L-glutamate gamma-semialdehyde dehydrogenase PutA [Kordiimonas sp. SCSIO 12610]
MAADFSVSTIAFDDDRSHINAAYNKTEDNLVTDLIGAYPFANSPARNGVKNRAGKYVTVARSRESERGLLDTFLQEFGLSNQEGVALMCLAEALLRVPDAETADRLIAEKIKGGDWGSHKGQSSSTFVNAATWGLMLTGQVVGLDTEVTGNTKSWMKGLVGRMGEPVVRTAINQAMKIMGGEFVLGRTIEEAIKRDASLSKKAKRPPLCSFDMLGEGARTDKDADNYYKTYAAAIKAVAETDIANPYAGHGISVKLSALHARYEDIQHERVMKELFPRIKSLALDAKAANMHLTIDAEEANRLHISLDIIRDLALDPDLAGWNGLGLALQCYSKRALPVLDWVIALSKSAGRRMMVRLVKGAYWDSEIKYAQEMGLEGYPVFTRKASTDLSYITTAKRALENRDAVYPQFATHNAHTIAAVMEIAETVDDKSAGMPSFEFQRLHGMGDLLYSAVKDVDTIPNVRTYAPVGNHKDLLAYLVRRLLENGANTSFVNRFMDDKIAVNELVEDPVTILSGFETFAHPAIALPKDMFGESRLNAKGLDITDRLLAQPLIASLNSLKGKAWGVGKSSASSEVVTNPANRADEVGHILEASADEAKKAVGVALSAQKAWDSMGGVRRGEIMAKVADALEANFDQFMSLLIREAGKTYADGVAEIREAVDFCRYYGDQAKREFEGAKKLPGPTGEDNLYSLHGRGVFVCISPWNFPLAIFMGQVAAALAAGNSVIAKPAEQTPLVAAEAVRIMHECGVPKDVLHLVPGRGETVGAELTNDPRIGGVAMTGSTATAKIIARVLAERDGPIIPFIAETGGQNAMFVDSTALPEQVVDDVIRSAFHSAGQRCSALRLLYVQSDIADGVIEMIKGAMDELTVGNPATISTDVGPVIDEEARSNLQAHCDKLIGEGKLLYKLDKTDDLEGGSFIMPHMFEIKSIGELADEQFGPILHVIKYAASDLDRHLDELRDTGYGLTLGVHSRIEGVADYIFKRSLAGNTYINRNMIGAVVGVQPFGGKGLSGTGPKAGGPLYMHRFAGERVQTINTVATGGNADLLSLG